MLHPSVARVAKEVVRRSFAGGPRARRAGGAAGVTRCHGGGCFFWIGKARGGKGGKQRGLSNSGRREDVPSVSKVRQILVI